MWNAIQTWAPIVYRVTIDLIIMGILCYVLEVLGNIPKMYAAYLNTKLYETNIKAESSHSVLNALDMIIKEVFNDYLIMNFYQISNDIYAPLNKEEQDKITKAVITIINSRLSGQFIDRLRIYYDLEELNKVIFNKVYLMTVAMAVEKNKAKNDNDTSSEEEDKK